ncbi:hypothetical protein BDV59DRAFT_188915 [Aspergillus ambiguus]|uniref:uncharacterized protein n=1 Tax=Aspergillus ambiguus TaxID=176160 RepID=UPI003CCCAAC3
MTLTPGEVRYGFVSQGQEMAGDSAEQGLRLQLESPPPVREILERGGRRPSSVPHWSPPHGSYATPWPQSCCSGAYNTSDLVHTRTMSCVGERRTQNISIHCPPGSSRTKRYLEMIRIYAENLEVLRRYAESTELARRSGLTADCRSHDSGTDHRYTMEQRGDRDI